MDLLKIIFKRSLKDFALGDNLIICSIDNNDAA